MNCSSSKLKYGFILLILNFLVYASQSASCTLCPLTYGIRDPYKEALPDGTTCLSIGIDGLLNAWESDDSCKEYYQLIGYVRCNCVPVPIPEIDYYGVGHCNLCEDGTEVPTPSAIYDSETGITCDEVMKYLTKFDFEGSDTCHSFQQRANKKCGCNGSQTTDEDKEDGDTTEAEEEDWTLIDFEPPTGQTDDNSTLTGEEYDDTTFDNDNSTEIEEEEEEEADNTTIGFEPPSDLPGDNSTWTEEEGNHTITDFEPPSDLPDDNSTEIEGEEENTVIDFEPPSDQPDDNSTEIEEDNETKFTMEPSQAPSIQPTVDDPDELSTSAATNTDDEEAKKIGTTYIGGIFIITLLLMFAVMTLYKRRRKRQNENIEYTKARDLVDLNETFDSDMNEEEGEEDSERNLGYHMDLIRGSGESNFSMYNSNGSSISGFSMNPVSSIISGTSCSPRDKSSSVSIGTVNQSSSASGTRRNDESTYVRFAWAVRKLEQFLH